MVATAAYQIWKQIDIDTLAQLGNEIEFADHGLGLSAAPKMNL